MRVSFFISLLCFLSLSGCAERFDELDQRVTNIQQRTALLEAKTGSPVGNDRELLEGQKVADVRSQVASLRNDLTVLAGKVEALEFENKRLSARSDQFAQDLEQKLKEASKPKPPAEPPAESTPAAAADSEYDAALKAHQDGDFAKAEKLFDTFVAKHPKNSLADNAIFWVGDGYMSQKMYKKAIAKFQDLIDRFPKSDKRCDAMAKQITAFSELGMKKEAGVFTQVRNTECK